jgi:hypothetical protein
MRRVLWLALLVLHAPCTSAETLESRALKAVLQARTPTEAIRVQAWYEELKVTRTACRIQLRERIVPSACYAVLEQERKLGLSSAAQARQQVGRLNSLCRSASARLQVPTFVPKGVPRACAHWVAEAVRINDYRREPLVRSLN